jgi:hypothetical protein
MVFHPETLLVAAHETYRPSRLWDKHYSEEQLWRIGNGVALRRPALA